MASSLIISWKIGKQWKQWQTLFSRASKIMADGDCSHEIIRQLLLGRKVITSLHSILKSKDITLPTKVHLVKAMVFPVVMYGCESWTIMKAESWEIDAFEVCCWNRPFFQYKFIYFNWKIITLQYCIGFAIYQHESTTPMEKTLESPLDSKEF